MQLSELTSVSPIDGRYGNKTKNLRKFFSEYALIKYRVQIEIEYFIALCQIPLPQLKKLQNFDFQKLKAIYHNFSLEDAQHIKSIEKITNHDVKAVEYFIKEKFDELGLSTYKEFIHFGLTSQDINNTAIPLSLKEAMTNEILPTLDKILDQIQDFANDFRNVPMLARTHGQPASPTRLGKEFYVFYERLKKQVDELKTKSYPAKFGGATGNFNAHVVAYPNIDWKKFANQFVNQELKLDRSQTTTQIEHYDGLASIFDNLKRINTILIDLARDIWTYISMEYFKQKINNKEVGSSAMPHKVNPIDFENAEGNLGMANAILEHLSAKLPISRLQRDLTDSTVLRNIGTPLAHSLIAYEAILKGFSKLLLNPSKIQEDLTQNWAVVAEAIQTILRREQYPNPYETLKALTRQNHQITAESIAQFIDTLDIDNAVKTELKQITPLNYTGLDF